MNPLKSNSNKIAGFIFNAQLAQEAIDHPKGKSGQNKELDFKGIAKKVSLDLFEKNLVEDATKMSAVYVAIASFENMLREIIVEKLLAEKGEKWWTTDSISSDIRKKAEKKEEDEKQHRWHTARGLNPIHFTELKDLVSIVCNEKNWPMFEDLFGNSDWVRHSIKALERSRNVIMHSGQLTVEDIERVGITIRDWMRQIGN